jgi:hypothetical protein
MAVPDKILLTPEEKSYIDKTTDIAVHKIKDGYPIVDIVNWLRKKYQKEFPIKVRKVEHKRPEAENETSMEESAEVC